MRLLMIMLKTYFKQALALSRQNCLFSTLYIAGTGLAIAMTVVMALVYYVKLAPVYPEENRENTLYLTHTSFCSEGYTVQAGLSFQAVQEWMYPLKNVEAVSAIVDYGMDESFYIQPTDLSGDFKVALKLTDPAFFRIYSFRFLEGNPFTDSDLASGIHTAVISDDLARRLFGTTQKCCRTFVFVGLCQLSCVRRCTRCQLSHLEVVCSGLFALFGFRKL